MKKFLPHILIAVLALGVIFAPNFVHAQEVAGALEKFVLGTFDIVAVILSPISAALMKLVSYLTLLSGVALNAAVYHTIINMKASMGSVAITESWGVVRDIANIGFIFVLLYASIKLIIGEGSGTQQLIKNVILAAILINFSLFFTKVAIDLANLVALTFYSAVAPGAIEAGTNFATAGVANGIMDALRINSIWQSVGIINDGSIFTISILGSVVLLISAFVFLAMAIMLVIRFVSLIFVLILSPIAFLAWVLPGLDDIAKKWREALIGQAIFAPIFFLMIWITLNVSKGISESFGNFSGSGGGWAAVLGANADAQSFSAGAIGIVINFAIIITFLIASLIIAKQQADRAPGGVKNLTKWALGAAGGGTFGLAGRLGRQTLGRAGAATLNDQALLDKASKGGVGGAYARLQLATARKASTSTFDARGVEGAGVLEAGKAGGKGGFKAETEANIKARQKEADNYKYKVTGDAVNRQIKAAYGDISKLSPEEQEKIRKEQDKILEEDAKIKNEKVLRQYENRLANSKWYVPQSYTSVEDREAARRLRSGKPIKSPNDEIADIVKKLIEEENKKDSGGTP